MELFAIGLILSVFLVAYVTRDIEDYEPRFVPPSKE
jgi:hypothetical protein